MVHVNRVVYVSDHIVAHLGPQFDRHETIENRLKQLKLEGGGGGKSGGGRSPRPSVGRKQRLSSTKSQPRASLSAAPAPSPPPQEVQTGSPYSIVSTSCGNMR